MCCHMFATRAVVLSQGEVSTANPRPRLSAKSGTVQAVRRAIYVGAHTFIAWDLRMRRARALPVGVVVEVELYEFDGAVGGELCDHGEAWDDVAGRKEEAVMRSSGCCPTR